METFREFLEGEFPGARISELSGTNNLVYEVRTAEGILVAKHVTDSDIPLAYLAEANAALAGHVPVQRIRRVWETRRGDPFDAVFAEYVEGRDLASALTDGRDLPATAELVRHLCTFALACRELPRMHDGFGLYKRDAPVIATHREFVLHYAGRYWRRARPFYDGTRVGRAVDEWLSGGFAEAAGRNPAPFTTVAIDVNLKNLIVTPGGGIVVLNVPIVGLSTPAQAVGAISAHLRNHPQHAPFLEAATAEVCPGDAEMVPHFELWALLGILSFYAAREPENRHAWRNWGAPVTLDEDFRNLVITHFAGSAAS
ncbi:hypothetical protein HNP84_001991 [Thermocatellispora tengchongensis]|uniref:Aminoglycoside phosphotransferase domain-containing protein n=1 Tax=Thermocatellispora tengchongensis TaxID=1073253 RepID=A0A840P8E7_9ACTN|nr:hypothetical protein [Thermocatellispora tengchongensis]MBB5132275.1 hypothetical protein [Thermocatellispora tengchongensis]